MADPRETITITKLDAARRQLRAAIELWFRDGDPVAIHTLAYGSHEIIHRLFRNKGLNDLMYDSSVIEEEYRGEANIWLKASANFFKHATQESEPDATKEFHPHLNHLFMVMSITGLLRMGERLSEVEMVFNLWNIIHHPHWFTENILENRLPVDELSALQEVGKGDFFKICFELVSRQSKT